MSKESATNLLKSGRMDEQKETKNYNHHENKSKTQEKTWDISRC